ncbi:bifunctional DNA primase/polymerase [Sporosarcina jeotgali]|uniref:Bifunctional DNA primase/polymerase n=1 Tax=Sporosarcina jeotgali TaxID=3020056 RepID=A0ABZ0KXZ1_9BACL|nr:bifunctional DNA primase/polymerase [Sporosarcina sp. B2O-1]WOV84723.1 bifunctional DNA primase/polymerase [Sporosarcina sp. B2O-1]
MENNIMVDEALNLLELQLVPMPLNGKRPLIKNWPNRFVKCGISKEDILHGIEVGNRKVVTYANKNIGILTGAISKCIVVDVDDMILLERLREYGDLPETWMVKTGRGIHIYFDYDPEVASMKLWGGIDILSDKKQCVAPPSKNTKGGYYEWILSPNCVKKAKIPEWFKMLLAQHRTILPSPSVYLNDEKNNRQNDNGINLRSIHWLAHLTKHTSNIKGKEWVSCRCPFHDDRNNSFSFHVHTGSWSCFAGCGKGNGIQFLQRIYNISKSEVWQLLKEQNRDG